MRSDAVTVEEYLGSLPDPRRVALHRVRRVILDNLDREFEEVMNWGMIAYQVPLSIHAATYNGKPLMYAALASQKHHMALYLTSVYADESAAVEFRRRYEETRKPLDMGKSCVRFKRAEDLPLDLIGATIGAMGAPDFVALVERSR